MLGLGKDDKVPLSSLLNCIKTKFHISKNLPQSHSTVHFFKLGQFTPSFPKSYIISEHGPHGPVSPIDQKLSLSPNLYILFLLTFTLSSQIPSASSSSV